MATVLECETACMDDIGGREEQQDRVAVLGGDRPPQAEAGGKEVAAGDGFRLASGDCRRRAPTPRLRGPDGAERRWCGASCRARGRGR